ncbi:JAB domain-containing protein [Kordia sp.]|uniref:JAB domain-containing protein n=1 Tax=Kordia sp. TaxID=1965332 RepID=UPI003D6C2670
MNIPEINVSYSNENNCKVKITNSQQTYKVAMDKWNQDTIEFQEEVKILLLNNSNIVLGMHELSKGGGTSSIIDIKIVVSIALKCNAFGVILLHNHPSGGLKPSGADKNITKRLKQACNYLDIQLIDHLIITKCGYFSFTDEKLL